jgi:type III secretory pathway component EscV
VLGCIDIDHPRVAVLSYQEIDPSFTIHPVGEIKAGGAEGFPRTPAGPCCA